MTMRVWKRYSGKAMLVIREVEPKKGEKRAFSVTVQKPGYTSAVRIAITKQSRPPEKDQNVVASRIARGALHAVLRGEWPKRTEDWEEEDIDWEPAVHEKRPKPSVKWFPPARPGQAGCGHVARPKTCGACKPHRAVL